MFIDAILLDLFAMSEKTKKRIMIENLWKDLIDCLRNEANLNCASDCLLINNTIFQIFGASV